MPQRIEKLAILFADISGSTVLYDTLGNARAREMVARCITLMAGRLAPHGGSLVKTIGDEIMCTFPTAEAALLAACEMHKAVETGKPGGDAPMFIRIGFHVGDVILEDGDVFGDAVNVAARITAVARARHIIASQEAMAALPQHLKDRANPIQRAAVKGKQDQITLYQFNWKPDDFDVTRVGVPTYRKSVSSNEELVLRYRDQRFGVNEDHKNAMLGRGDNCEIAIRDTFASRQHARVEYRFGKFIVSDQSINGTYIQFADGHALHIVREELPLRGSGKISLGRPFSENPTEIIDFAVAATDESASSGS